MTDEAPAAARPQASFLGSVNVVMATYAADGLLALATGALVARALGPEGRGAYGLFVLAAAFMQLVLGLGIGNAAIYYINKQQLDVRAALASVHTVVLGAACVAALIVAAVAPWAGDEVFGAAISPWLLIAAVPVLLYAGLLRLLLQALSRFLDLGIATVGQQAVLLVLVSIAYGTGDPSATQFVAYLLIATSAAAAYSLARLGIGHVDLAAMVRPDIATLRRLAGFGVQGEAGNVLQMLNYRLDQYIVRGFVSLAGVGIYAVGVSMTEAVFILANAVALVLMPRLAAADPEEAAWMAPVASRNTIMIAAAGSAVLAAAAPVLLPAVFGSAYDESVRALWWLLPGTVALAGSKVLTSYIFSQGKPLVNTMITMSSLVVTVAADLALVPAFGVEGAAAASSLAYGAHLAAALYAYRRIAGRPALEALVPRPSDARLYADAVRSVIARVSGRSAAEAR